MSDTDLVDITAGYVFLKTELSVASNAMQRGTGGGESSRFNPVFSKKIKTTTGF